jgi:hypothetical protein
MLAVSGVEPPSDSMYQQLDSGAIAAGPSSGKLQTAIDASSAPLQWTARESQSVVGGKLGERRGIAQRIVAREHRSAAGGAEAARDDRVSEFSYFKQPSHQPPPADTRDIGYAGFSSDHVGMNSRSSRLPR